MKSGLASDPALSKLVDKQLRSWELARNQRPAASSPGAREVQDFITLSRAVGVDSQGIAADVAAELGWPVFGREILDAMAGDDAVRKRIYATMDQRDLTWWEEAIRGVMDSSFKRNDYFRRLCETVLSLARQSPSVFVGRGTDLILPRDRGLRVRLVAPLEFRVRSFVADTGRDPEDARQELEQVERHRTEFLEHHFGVPAQDPLRHDLVLNLECWSRAEVGSLIIEAHRMRERGSR